MEAQRLLNVDFVSAHEQLRTNVNAFWGPESAPFCYTTSKWGRESSVEMSSDSDDSYQTPPVVGSLPWIHPRGVHPQGETTAEEAGDTCRLVKSWNSLSSIRSQPHVLPSGGLMRILKRRGRRQAKGKLVKASWTNLSRKSVETGSSGSSKRVRSPTPLEYALDHQVPSLSRGPQEDWPSCEDSPDYSKWVLSGHFAKMEKWLANVDLGKPPSDEEEARGQFGIGWAEEAARAEAEAHQDFEDEEIKGLVDTHSSPIPRCG